MPRRQRTEGQSSLVSNADFAVIQLACKTQRAALARRRSSAMAWGEDIEPCQHGLAYSNEGRTYV